MKKIFCLLSAMLMIGSITISSCCTPKHKHAYMRRTFKQIKRKVKKAQVSSINDSVKVIFPENLTFLFNSSSLDSNSMPSFKRFSKILNRFDRTAVMISGYTDSIGSDDYNNELSAKRADTTKSVLIKYDVASDRINTWGMGKRHPIAPNSTEEGRSRNRRVEFIILYKENSK